MAGNPKMFPESVWYVSSKDELVTWISTESGLILHNLCILYQVGVQ